VFGAHTTWCATEKLIDGRVVAGIVYSVKDTAHNFVASSGTTNLRPIQLNRRSLMEFSTKNYHICCEFIHLLKPTIIEMLIEATIASPRSDFVRIYI